MSPKLACVIYHVRCQTASGFYMEYAAFRFFAYVRSCPRNQFALRQLRTGPSIQRDRAARRAVAALDLYRSEKKKRVGRQSAEVGQELNPDHWVTAQRPVSAQRLLFIHATESRSIGADATTSLGVHVLDGIRAERRTSLAFAERLGGPLGVTAAQEHDLVRPQGAGLSCPPDPKRR